jgi:hypothetical protein
VPYLPVIIQLLESIGIDVVGVADYEAEDVIATLTRLAPGIVEIASGDRDLFALVEDPRVRVLYPERSGLAAIDETEVTRRYGIPGRRYAEFAILRGDPSDGLPGLKGIGAVTAAAMIRRHGDIAGVLRDRPLPPADREYLEVALTVVGRRSPRRAPARPAGRLPDQRTRPAVARLTPPSKGLAGPAAQGPHQPRTAATRLPAPPLLPTRRW